MRLQKLYFKQASVPLIPLPWLLLEITFQSGALKLELGGGGGGGGGEWMSRKRRMGLLFFQCNYLVGKSDPFVSFLLGLKSVNR